MNRFFGHLSTITRHKIKVTLLCFRCGLYAREFDSYKIEKHRKAA